ncbi:MAG: hypothetical protein CL612_06330 [Anaerolineaceae bacterium]|nr:hypothetical protein [Anaerolineaceae bacterium]
MTHTMVTLDLETTGLDTSIDEIIEIGAVKFRGDEIKDEFQTLINPGKNISQYITQLTSITNEMVSTAPSVHDKISQLQKFVGNDPIIGHNIQFDLNFLGKYGAFLSNSRIDTMHVAACVLPSAARYSLGSLAMQLEVELPATHRALDDARVTFAIYTKMISMAKDIPSNIVMELLRLSRMNKGVEWGAELPLDKLLDERQKEFPGQSQENIDLYNFDELAPESEALRPRDDDHKEELDISALEALFSSNGLLSKNLENFEHRVEQIEMMRNVAKAISHPRHLLVEAGTGIGKSLAYLVPAIKWACTNDERVVVSTNTINLQDQLINKDVPVLDEILDMPFRAVVQKGRGNYICPRRFDILRKRGPNNVTEMNVLAKLYVWLAKSKSGDRSEINLSGPGELAVWSRISAEDENCTKNRCAKVIEGGCPFDRARREAESAHLVVVNHALLLADVASENHVLPEYRYLIIDEAHHLEDATTNGLSFAARQIDFERLLKNLVNRKSGLLKQLMTRVHKGSARKQQIKNDVDGTSKSIENVLIHSTSFFKALKKFAQYQDSNSNGGYDRRLLIKAESRNSSEWADVEIVWENLHNTLTSTIKRLKDILDEYNKIVGRDRDEDEELQSNIGSIIGKLNDFDTRVHGLVTEAQDDQIFWIHLSNDGNLLTIRSAPLHVGPLVQEHLWYEKNAVVMTSATLTTTAGNFSFIRNRLHAEDADEVAIGSPFDYKKSTLLCIPSDVAEPPNRERYQKDLEEGIVELCKATNGRALVLFTSHVQLRDTAHAIRGPLEREGIMVYDQSGSASRHQLLTSFRNADKAVLLGTQSFWEGIDVAGSALSVVVIARLPFDVPSDPIIQSRSAVVEQDGQINAFVDYLVPKAIIRFRQGFGRLIRSKKDRGLIVVFDRRIITKSYGRTFLESLPDCKKWRGNLSDLPNAAAMWINK